MPRCSTRRARSTGSRRFASLNGPAFYGLPVNTETVTLVRESWLVPERIGLSRGTEVVPFDAGEPLAWRLQD